MSDSIKRKWRLYDAISLNGGFNKTSSPPSPSLERGHTFYTLSYTFMSFNALILNLAKRPSLVDDLETLTFIIFFISRQ